MPYAILACFLPLEKRFLQIMLIWTVVKPIHVIRFCHHLIVKRKCYHMKEMVTFEQGRAEEVDDIDPQFDSASYLRGSKSERNSAEEPETVG